MLRGLGGSGRLVQSGFSGLWCLCFKILKHKPCILMTIKKKKEAGCKKNLTELLAVCDQPLSLFACRLSVAERPKKPVFALNPFVVSTKHFSTVMIPCVEQRSHHFFEQCWDLLPCSASMLCLVPRMQISV